MNSLKDIATVVKGQNYDLVVKSLKDKNKNLTEALSRLCKVSMKCLDGDGTIQELQDCINEANDVMIGNSVNLIDFPTYVKRKHSDFPVFCKQVIDIYNEWNK